MIAPRATGSECGTKCSARHDEPTAIEVEARIFQSHGRIFREVSTLVLSFARRKWKTLLMRDCRADADAIGSLYLGRVIPC
jgi:hypothetical protein